MAHFLGLDLSLNGSGIIIIDSHLKLKLQITLKQDSDIAIEQRLINLRNCITGVIEEYNKKPLIAVIENFSSHASIYPMETGAAHYLPRTLLFENNIPFALVHLKRLKIFATGKGTAKKTDMVKAAKRYGFEPKSHDEADAYFLAKIGWHLFHADDDSLTRKQLDVLIKTKQDNPTFNIALETHLNSKSPK
jgi:Holliday junction resolvasome RuvABC endonuclease subunit